MDKLRCLDLFCKAGGMTRGYQLAGFHVTGVDIEPQPHYIGDEFIQADVMTLDIEWMKQFDLISASPPCQHYSQLTPSEKRCNHPDLIEPVRKMLDESGKPYVIENVAGAKEKFHSPAMLCGTMFGMNIFRHRYFEIPWLTTYLLPPCNHGKKPVLISGTHKRSGEPRRENSAAEKREAIGIDWMTVAELDEAIPPAYSQWIGERFLELRCHREPKNF